MPTREQLLNEIELKGKHQDDVAVVRVVDATNVGSAVRRLHDNIPHRYLMVRIYFDAHETHNELDPHIDIRAHELKRLGQFLMNMATNCDF